MSTDCIHIRKPGAGVRPGLVTLGEIREAHRRVAGVALRTPIVLLKSLGRPETYGKCENLQQTGSFKIRGAYHKIAGLPRSCKGVVAFSSGNHAQAVAFAARKRGLRACIVMPENPVARKLEATRALGAEVILIGASSEVLRMRAEREAASRGYTLVPPFDDPEIIAGQGSVGLEILEDMPDVGSVIVAIGGGGLASGVAAALKQTRRGVRVFGVEPRSAPKTLRSLQAGSPVALEHAASVADGLLALRPGDLTFAHLRKYLDDVVLVSDAEILAASRDLLLKEALVVEPSGAATVAAILSGRLRLPRGPVVAVLSGGNADIRQILNWEARTDGQGRDGNRGMRPLRRDAPARAPLGPVRSTGRRLRPLQRSGEARSR